ncbi:hypothetical protein [Actinomadura rubrisoli]|uniref:Uncharacterized protein n=1 Tax=Actinomadura rubrisoli TaxID=2530368 RepID=A0A4R5BY80_9ACTN|nr:hypothetical protein [Actinomadura rubrisoli]TDD89354.1 hypothetical protein E1298_14165 [Actinomadura rubrisoli]
MKSMLIKSAPTWTPACPGASIAYSAASVWTPQSLKPCGPMAHGGANAPISGSIPANGRPDAFGARLRDLTARDLTDLRTEQRVQDEQGRTVFAHLIEDSGTQAPATAHMGVSLKGGVSGPYPWRRPV